MANCPKCGVSLTTDELAKPCYSCGAIPKMKTFRLTADCMFDADDLDHAFEKLGKHFLNMTAEDWNAADELDLVGRIELKAEPVDG